MIVNVQAARYSDKVYHRLHSVYMRQFTDEYQLHYNYGDDILRSHTGRTLFCEWLESKEILNAKSWEVVLDSTNAKQIGGGFNINEDGLLTRFLLECE